MRKLVVFFIFCVSGLSSYAALITSVSDGEWKDPATWDLGSIPQDGDEIKVNHSVTVFGGVILDNVKIEVNDEIILGGWDGFLPRGASPSGLTYVRDIKTSI